MLPALLSSLTGGGAAAVWHGCRPCQAAREPVNVIATVGSKREGRPTEALAEWLKYKGGAYGRGCYHDGRITAITVHSRSGIVAAAISCGTATLGQATR